MASSATHHALDIPIYAAAYNVPLVWLDADGDPTLPVSLDIEVSKDNGTFANATNAAVLAKEVGGSTDSAYGYVTLTAAEMTCDILLGQAKDSTQKATPFTLRPKRLPVVRDSQCTDGGNSTATLDANASAVDDYYNGCILFLNADTGTGQARRILSYVGSTKVATIAGTWETNPDATTDYQVLATPEWLTALNTRAILALPAAAPNASGGLPTFGTGTGQLNVTGGRADSDLVYIHGSALTETSAGYLAAAFVKLFDVATPLLVASAAMRGTDSAALASDWTGTLATNLGTLFARAITTGALPNAAAGANGGLAIVDANGRTDVNLEAILGTALTETSAGYLAAAFKKLFDVATPLLVASDAMRGTDGAALASAYTGTRAGYLDNLSAGAVALASGVDLTSIHGTALTESGSGRLAAAFVKLFDVVTPLLVASDAMRGTDSAATAAKLLDYVQLLARSDAAITTDNAVALGEINTNEGSGAGDFSNQTEAVEALRDRGDSAWDTATGFAVAGDQMDLVNAPNGTAVTAIQNGLATSANQTTILNRIGDFAGTGLNTIKGFLQAFFRSDAGVTGANTPSEINEAENTVVGTFDGTTESQQAQVDVGVTVKDFTTAAKALLQTEAADALAAAYVIPDESCIGTIQASPAPTTSSFTAAVTSDGGGFKLLTANEWRGRPIKFATGDLAGHYQIIVSNTAGSTCAFTVYPGLPAAPTADDTFRTKWGYIPNAAVAGDEMGLVDGTITASKIATNAIDDDALAADTDVYEARVTLFVDGANVTDRYAVGFFKNGAPVTSGITVPTLTVYQMNVAGTVLVNGKTLLQAGSTGLYYYDTTTELSTAGVGYQSLVTATIDGSSRSMTQPVGRDTSA